MSVQAEVRILTANFVDSTSSIVSSHGGTVANLYDRDLQTKWKTSGANSDGTEAILTITFFVGVTETAFGVNSIILIGNNFKAFTLEYWNGSDYVALPNWTAQTANTETSFCVTFNYTSTSRIRIRATETMKPNREKEICELVIARQRFSLSENPKIYNLTFSQKVKRLELGDGGVIQSFTRFATNRTQRYSVRVSFTLLSRTDYERLYTLKNEGVPFLFYAESYQVPSEIWYVNWVNAWTAKYSVSFKGAGYDVDMELMEV